MENLRSGTMVKNISERKQESSVFYFVPFVTVLIVISYPTIRKLGLKISLDWITNFHLPDQMNYLQLLVSLSLLCINKYLAYTRDVKEKKRDRRRN